MGLDLFYLVSLTAAAFAAAISSAVQYSARCVAKVVAESARFRVGAIIACTRAEVRAVSRAVTVFMMGDFFN